MFRRMCFLLVVSFVLSVYVLLFFHVARESSGNGKEREAGGEDIRIVLPLVTKRKQLIEKF